MQKRIIRITHWLALLLLSITFVAVPTSLLAQADSPANDENQPFHTTDTPIPPFAPGVVLVGVRGDGVTAAAAPWSDLGVLAAEPLPVRLGTVGTLLGTLDAGDVTVDDSNVDAASRAADTTPVIGYRLTVPAGTEWSVIESLTMRDEVVFADPDWIVQIAQDAPDADGSSDPNRSVAEVPYVIPDSLYAEQWYMQRIGISRAWALAESQGELHPVRVFVIDTGVDFAHPDLADRVTAGQSYVFNTPTAFDDFGHGTHVTGLIAAALNGEGIVGSALQVEITPLKALNSNGSGSVAAVAQALDDAVDAGAELVNMSLQLPNDSPVLRAAVADAVDAGVLIVAAAGNNGRLSLSYPAAYPGVLSVGATTYDDVRAGYSNRGAGLDIMAPGGLTSASILSTWTSGATCKPGLLVVDGGRYCRIEGTSMATGIASGVAALIMSLRPDLDAEEVQEILIDSAAPLAGDPSEVGNGRLDAAAAVRLALEPRLIYDERMAAASALVGQGPITRTLSLRNASLEPLSVQVAQTMTTTWYALAGPSSGEVRYGEPLDVQLVYTPTAVDVGTVSSSLRVSATAAGGGTSVYMINTALSVFPAGTSASHHYIAWVGSGLPITNWALPAGANRTNYAIGNDSSIVIDLPFTMTVQDNEYTDLRVYADGFVVAPAAAVPERAPNTCLDNRIDPPYAVYGWWSDLSLGSGSALSTFQPDTGHFVIEYKHFASADSSDPDDHVSFQIILDPLGQVQINYGETPEHEPAAITIGVSRADGRFYNQVVCHLPGSALTGTRTGTHIGEVPKALRTFSFATGDFY